MNYSWVDKFQFEKKLTKSKVNQNKGFFMNVMENQRLINQRFSWKERRKGKSKENQNTYAVRTIAVKNYAKLFRVWKFYLFFNLFNAKLCPWSSVDWSSRKCWNFPQLHQLNAHLRQKLWWKLCLRRTLWSNKLMEIKTVALKQFRLEN